MPGRSSSRSLWRASAIRVFRPGTIRSLCAFTLPGTRSCPGRKVAHSAFTSTAVAGPWGASPTYDSITRALANEIPALVISVDYRLAPEHPFPAGTEDAYLAMEWVARNGEEIGGDPARIAVAGDSGGGTPGNGDRAEGETGRREHRFPGPLLSIDRYLPTDYPSYDQYGQGYLLTKKSVESFRKFDLPNPHDWTNPDASPLRSSNDDLAVLPPTLIIVAGCDPLREEGIAYARKLRDNGVPVTSRTEEEMIHGFLSF